MQPQASEDRFVLDLRPEPRYVGTARAFAASIARHFDCSEDCVQDIKVAISEACSNAIKAHAANSTRSPVRLVVEHDEDRLSYEIVDSGGGFDTENVSERAMTSDDLFEGGIGLMLIRSLFPSAEVVRNSDRGMTVRFSVDLPEATHGRR